MSDVTFVITSCGRFELLEKTLDSFKRANDYPISKYIITEDSGSVDNYNKIVDKYGKLFDEIIFHKDEPRKGTPIIDEAYEKVETEYIFHCENDWMFHNKHNGSFIKDSMDILEFSKQIVAVWIRDWNDLSHHKPHHMRTKGNDIEFNYIFYWGLWGGFTLNPGLRRTKDWERIGGYSRFYNKNGQPNAWVATEHRISEWYSKNGYLGAWLGDYCYHIG